MGDKKEWPLPNWQMKHNFKISLLHMQWNTVVNIILDIWEENPRLELKKNNKELKYMKIKLKIALVELKTVTWSWKEGNTVEMF